MKAFRESILIIICILFCIETSLASFNIIAAGGDVFIGEQNLDVTAAVTSGSQIAWFASGTNPNTDAPNYQINVGDATQFYVAPADFVGRTGNWYRSWGGGKSTVAFTVIDPSIDIKVWDNTANKDVSGKQVAGDHFLNFRVETNTYSVASRPGFNPNADGFITIKVKNSGGTTYAYLWQSQFTTILLTNLPVDKSLFYWVAVSPTAGWNTAAIDGGGFRIYQTGTYVVSAELTLNGINNNYRAPDNSPYTGKTVTAQKTVTLINPTPTPTPTPTNPSSTVKNIAAGGDVFIGEQGLDISSVVTSNSNIAWFASGTNPNTDSPNYQLNVGDSKNFYVSPADFVGRTGNWYRSWGGGTGSAVVAFTVIDPSIDIKVWDNTANKDVTGKQVNAGNYLNFRVETNTYPVALRPGYNPATDGFINIKVKNAGGSIYTSLWQSQTISIPLTKQTVDKSLYYWVAVTPTSGWNTAVLDGFGSRIYNAGTYTVNAELALNKIRDNYRAPDGSDYTGKTVTALKTITIADPISTPTPTPSPTQPSVGYQLELYPGWNFISLPRTLIESKSTAGAAFSDVNTGGRPVYTYDCQNSKWIIVKNTDTIKCLDGLWLYSENHIFIPLNLVQSDYYPIVNKPLYQGWNSVGMNGLTQRTARDVLFSNKNQWVAIIGYDASKQQYEPSIINGGTGAHSDLLYLKPTKGYWIQMNGPGTLSNSASTSTPTATPTPTPTGSFVCDCSYDRYNCADFATAMDAQNCYNYCKSLGKGDIHRLDADNDGIACESL